MNYMLASTAALLLAIVPVACGPNLSTDARVRTAASGELGRDLGDDSCITRVSEPTRMILVGEVREGEGCHLVGAFVGRDWLGPQYDLARIALDQAGWSTATGERREALAFAYLRNVYYAFSGSMLTADFYENVHPPPSTEALPDGGVRIVAGIARQVSNGNGLLYEIVQHDFAASGSLGVRTLQAGPAELPADQ